MIRIRLGEADRKELGAPEEMPVDPARMRLAEVRALHKETGYTVETLSTALTARDLEAVAALVWVGLRRAGVQVDFADLDFDFAELELEVDDPNSQAPQGASTAT